jgi:hypothetical protein
MAAVETAQRSIERPFLGRKAANGLARDDHRLWRRFQGTHAVVEDCNQQGKARPKHCDRQSVRDHGREEKRSNQAGREGVKGGKIGQNARLL